MRLLWFYLRFIRNLFGFYRRAQTIYDIHSPFVADFLRQIVADRRQFYAFPLIEHIRKDLLRDKRLVAITDFGAGSQADGRLQRPLRSIARFSPVHPEEGQLLFRLVNRYRPKTIVELGTSLGISAMYLHAAARQARLITVEGCPETAALAREQFRKMGFDGIELRQGAFSIQLPQILASLERVDLLYLDGDHREGSTWAYFQACLEKAGTHSIFIIADIHWSDEMARAWARMKAHPRTSLSIELWHLGLLFFDDAFHEPQHFTLVPWWWKPWRMGLFS